MNLWPARGPKEEYGVMCGETPAVRYRDASQTGVRTAWAARRRLLQLPRAVRRVSYRVVLYYVGAVIALGLNVSANDPILKSQSINPGQGYSSPFVLMVRRAGIPGLAHVINAVALIASVSVANANLYVSVYTQLLVMFMLESNFVCSCQRRPGF